MVYASVDHGKEETHTNRWEFKEGTVYSGWAKFRRPTRNGERSLFMTPKPERARVGGSHYNTETCLWKRAA